MPPAPSASSEAVAARLGVALGSSSSGGTQERQRRDDHGRRGEAERRHVAQAVLEKQAADRVAERRRQHQQPAEERLRCRR